MKEKIENILKNALPEKAFFIVQERINSFDKSPQIAIFISASDNEIYRVKGQHPQLVSLLLDLKTMELYPQVFGGLGGQHIYRQPNKNEPKEKYLVMQSIKIPFRKPQPNEKAVLTAIEKFAKNWLTALKENKDVLMYKDLVDYNELLK